MPKRKSVNYLFIDAVTSRDLVVAEVSSRNGLLSRRVFVNGTRTESLIRKLSIFLSPTNKIQGIILAQGTGSYSQSRLACAVVNALAYAYKLKLARVDSQLEINQLPLIIKGLKWHALLKPYYYGPAASK